MTSEPSRRSFRPQAVAPRSAADQIASQLRAALIDGSLRPGDRLGTEPDLAGEFGVSRATVREAIKILRAQGVLRTARGARGGHFVVSPQTDVLAESIGETFGLWFDAGDISVAEVDEARVVVERACVRLAAERRSEDDLAEMEGHLAKAGDRSLGLAEFLALDTAFHRVVARAAHNRLLEMPMTAIHLVRPRTNQVLRRHDRPAVTAQHRSILAAIAAKDADKAERAFLDHVSFLDVERKAAIAARRRPAADLPLNELTPLGGDDGSGLPDLADLVAADSDLATKPTDKPIPRRRAPAARAAMASGPRTGRRLDTPVRTD